MAVSDWSTTASDNDAAPPNGAPEGWVPSQINDTIRQIMADVRSFYDATALLAATTVNFTGTLQYDGNEVGNADLIRRDFSGNASIATTDRGRSLRYTGAGGHTLTLSAIQDNALYTVFNAGSGNLTLDGSGVTLQWFNGSGTVDVTGTRTLAVAGVASLLQVGSGAIYVWGAGLS
jgi:hypothetical protein